MNRTTVPQAPGLDLVAHQAALADALADEEPASDLGNIEIQPFHVVGGS